MCRLNSELKCHVPLLKFEICQDIVMFVAYILKNECIICACESGVKWEVG